jgi:hypothetical protein
VASPVTPLDAAAVPRNQYRARLDAWSKILSTEDKRYQQVSDLRLWVVIAGIAAAWWNLPFGTSGSTNAASPQSEHSLTLNGA